MSKKHNNPITYQTNAKMELEKDFILCQNKIRRWSGFGK